MKSIRWKLTLSFLLVVSVSALVAAYIAKVNITDQFWSYLGMGHMHPVPDPAAVQALA